MAQAKRDYAALAATIIENVGGAGNVISYRHCITRVRFRLKDESQANDDVLKATDGVITIAKGGGEYMVVIGNEVVDVYDAVAAQLGPKDAEALAKADGTAEDEKSGNVVIRTLNTVMASLGPALNLICAGGITKGIISLIGMFGLLSADSSLYIVLNATGDAIFNFLPIILGYNFCKHLNVDGTLGAVIGAILCYPTITGQELTFFGFTNTATYTSSFLPVILICALAVPLYKLLNKYIPRAVSGFLVPTVTLLIVMPIGIALIGPFATLLGNGVANVINTLMSTVPLLGGAVFGALYQVLVLFGIHQAVTSFAFMNLLGGNADPIMAISCYCCFAQIGVVLAMYLKTKDEQLKEVAFPAFVSGVFGVTEPAIYGVTLPHMKMFVISCIGASIMGAFMMVTNTIMYSFTGLGVFAVIGMINPNAPALVLPIVSAVIGFAASFAIAFALFKDEQN